MKLWRNLLKLSRYLVWRYNVTLNRVISVLVAATRFRVHPCSQNALSWRHSPAAPPRATAAARAPWLDRQARGTTRAPIVPLEDCQSLLASRRSFARVPSGLRAAQDGCHGRNSLVSQLGSAPRVCVTPAWVRACVRACSRTPVAAGAAVNVEIS